MFSLSLPLLLENECILHLYITLILSRSLSLAFSLSYKVWHYDVVVVVVTNSLNSGLAFCGWSGVENHNIIPGHTAASIGFWIARENHDVCICAVVTDVVELEPLTHNAASRMNKQHCQHIV